MQVIRLSYLDRSLAFCTRARNSNSTDALLGYEEAWQNAAFTVFDAFVIFSMRVETAMWIWTTADRASFVENNSVDSEGSNLRWRNEHGMASGELPSR